MDPVKYYNLKNTIEISDMGREFYHFKAVFNGGFISGMYTYEFNAIVPPIFGVPLEREEESELVGFLKNEIEKLKEKETEDILRQEQEEELRIKQEKDLRRKRRNNE